MSDRSSKRSCALCGRFDRFGGLYEISGKNFYLCRVCYFKLEVWYK